MTMFLPDIGHGKIMSMLQILYNIYVNWRERHLAISENDEETFGWPELQQADSIHHFLSHILSAQRYGE